MKTNKIKRINSHQLKQKYNKYYNREPNEVISWEFRQFLEALAEDGLYEYDYSKRNSKLRITFPLFLAVIFIFTIVGAFKWLFTGDYYFKHDSWIIRNISKWDKYCGFNIM